MLAAAAAHDAGSVASSSSGDTIANLSFGANSHLSLGANSRTSGEFARRIIREAGGDASLGDPLSRVSSGEADFMVDVALNFLAGGDGNGGIPEHVDVVPTDEAAI